MKNEYKNALIEAIRQTTKKNGIFFGYTFAEKKGTYNVSSRAGAVVLTAKLVGDRLDIVSEIESLEVKLRKNYSSLVNIIKAERLETLIGKLIKMDSVFSDEDMQTLENIVAKYS